MKFSLNTSLDNTRRDMNNLSAHPHHPNLLQGIQPFQTPVAKKNSLRGGFGGDQLNSERLDADIGHVKTSLVPIEAILNANTSRGKVEIG